MNLLMKGAALAPPFSCTTKYSSDVYSPRPPDIRVRLLPTKPPVHFTTEQPGRDIKGADPVARKAQYQTKQMAELLAFLKSVPGSHITVNDICDHFKKEGITVGMTTVYRHLERMVKQGVVAKYIIEGSSSACFEYIGGQDDCEPPSCYHCKCEKCGKLLHVQCGEVAHLGQHMLEHHGFEMDSLRTIFYGICSECRKTGC